MARSKRIPDAMANALDLLTRSSVNQSVFVRPHVYGPIADGSGRWDWSRIMPPEGMGEEGHFRIGLEEVNGLEEWITAHPLMGPGKRYRLVIFLPARNGNPSPTPSKTIEVNLADPGEQAAQAFEGRANAAFAQQGTAAAFAGFEANRAAAAANQALATIEGAASLADSDPQAFLSKIEDAKKELAAMSDAAKSAAAASAQMVATTQAAANVVANLPARTAMPGQTPLAAVAYGAGAPMAGPYNPYLPQPQYQQFQQPQYPPPQPQIVYAQPPAAPAVDTGTSKALEAMVTLLTAQMKMPPPTPSAPAVPPEITRMLEEMRTNQARLEAQLVEQKAEAERARQEARHQREMAELTAKIERLSNDKPNQSSDVQVKLAEMQMQSAAKQQEQTTALIMKMNDVQAKAQEQIIDILQNSGNDDASEQVKRMSALYGEMMTTGMQAMRMAAQLRNDSKPEDSGPEDKLLDKLAALAGAALGGGGQQQPMPPQYAPPPPQYQQPQVQYVPPPPQAQPQLPAPQQAQQAGQPMPPPTPPTAAAPPRAPKDVPAAEYVQNAQAAAAAGQTLEAFKVLFTGFHFHPEIVGQAPRLAVANELLGQHFPDAVTLGDVEQALEAIGGPALVAELRALNGEPPPQAAPPPPAPQPPPVVLAPVPSPSAGADDDGDGGDEDDGEDDAPEAPHASAPNGAAAPASAAPVVIPAPQAASHGRHGRRR